MSLEKVYATIIYYLQNKETVSEYIADWLEWGHQQHKAQALNPPPGIVRLRKIKLEIAAMEQGKGA